MLTALLIDDRPEGYSRDDALTEMRRSLAKPLVHAAADEIERETWGMNDDALAQEQRKAGLFPSYPAAP